MKYAEDNSVIARSIYDESPIESSFSATGQELSIWVKPSLLQKLFFGQWCT